MKFKTNLFKMKVQEFHIGDCLGDTGMLFRRHSSEISKRLEVL